MKEVRTLSIVTQVKQIMEVDSVELANELLKSKEWILLNSYRNAKISKTKPVMRLGRIV
ncbi:MAG: hypothetical protein FWG63_00715 [Defluviitaleaceae bacterium]|nr:hypothetical protein [Defluviitaleaceae bacterium]